MTTGRRIRTVMAALATGLVVELSAGGDVGAQADCSIASFGAVADGTDASVAIQQALWACGAVYVPPGTWHFASSLTVPANRRLIGAGHSAVLNYTGPDTALQLNAGGPVLGWRSSIESLRLTTVMGQVGIWLWNASEVMVQGVLIDGFRRTAILSDGSFPLGSVLAIRITDSLLLGNGRGVELTGHNTHTGWSIKGSRIQGSTAGPGLDLRQAVGGWAIEGNIIEGNVGAQIRFGNSAAGVAIVGNYFEARNDGQDNGIELHLGHYLGVTVMANFFGGGLGGTAIGLWGTSLSGVVVKGNYATAYTCGVCMSTPAQDSDIGANSFSHVAFPYYP